MHTTNAATVATRQAHRDLTRSMTPYLDPETAAHQHARMCKRLRELDHEFATDPASPLHHDNRCHGNSHH